MRVNAVVAAAADAEGAEDVVIVASALIGMAVIAKTQAVVLSR